MHTDITSAIGEMPFRMALAGGWIDQPFLSRHNPSPPGSMVVVSLEPTCRFMNRCGMATSTREIAMRLWGDDVPQGKPHDLVKELYTAENQGKAEPSGSQDMIGLIHPGVSRLDYDSNYEGGYFPVHIESNNDPETAHWLEEGDPHGAHCSAARWVRAFGQKKSRSKLYRKIGSVRQKLLPRDPRQRRTGLGRVFE